MKKDSVFCKIFSSRSFAIVVLLLCIAFIFSRSMKVAGQSSGESGGLIELINRICLSLFGFEIKNIPIAETVIRKLAHFIEFFSLGLVVYYFRFAFAKKANGYIVHGILCGLSVALTDETIQYFYSGRSPQVSDVWVDFGGFLVGYLLIFAVFALVERKLKKYPRT